MTSSERTSGTAAGVAEGNGRRVDPILATQPFADRSTSAWIDLEPRRGEKPLDPALLVVEFKT